MSFCDLNKVLATVINNNTLKNKKKNCLLKRMLVTANTHYSSIYFYFAKHDSSDSLLVVNPSITLKPIANLPLIQTNLNFPHEYLLLKIRGRTEKKMTTPRVGMNPATIWFKILFFSASFNNQGK